MIVIATPSRDTVHATFAYDLARAIKERNDTIFSIALGSHLPNLRTGLVREALNNNASHILFIDSDMRFPKDIIKRLLRHNLDVVGANCNQRAAQQTTARVNGEFVSSAGKSGLQKVDTVGFGVTMIRAAVFRKFPEPWFAMPYDGSKFIGEDVFFCEMAKKSGIDIFIDHDISHEIKHTGTKEY